MTRALNRLIAACVLLLLAIPATAADVPYLTGRVVDNANILSDGARTRLTDILKQHEQATTNQIVVLTVPTIGDDSVEEYAVKVFETWKLGQKGKDNGVLIVVAPQDRKMRIEVGYGLESTLTDGTCGEIIRTYMTPEFKKNDYDKGVEDGVAAIVAKLQGGTPPPAPAVESSDRSPGIEAVDLPWPMRILMGAFIFGIIGLFTVMGVLTPGMGWFLYFFLIPFWAMFPIIIVGPHLTFVMLVIYVIGYPVVKLSLRNTDWYKKAAIQLKTTGTASIGGFTFSTAGAVGGGDGGGFSGGGGSSGGGGASGSW